MGLTQITTGGVDENINIDSNTLKVDGTNNRVGIGTAAPDGSLHVHSGTAGSVTANGNADDLIVESSGTGGISILTPDANHSYVIFGSPTSNEGAILRYRDSDNLFTIGTEDSNGALAFRSGAGSERLRIDSSGRLGIGTSSPSGGQLVVNSTLDASNKQLVLRDATNGWTRKIGVDSSNNMAFYDGDTERMRIDSAGRLLAGTTSTYDGEASNFVVVTSGHTGITVASTGSNKRTNLYFADGTSGTAAYAGGFTYDHSDNSLLVRTASTERMRIDSSGRLLVGTSSHSSSAKFVVRARTTDSTSYANIALEKGSAPTSSNPTLGVINFTDNSERQAAYVLGAFDAGTWTDGSSHPGRLVFATTANGASSATERMRIDSSGNLRTPEKQDVVFGVDLNTTSGDGGDLTVKSGNGFGSGNDSGNLYLAAGRGGSGADSGFIAFGIAKTTNTSGLDTEFMRIQDTGHITIGKTSTSFGDQGIILRDNGESFFTKSGTPVYINRENSDGNLIQFYQDENIEGSISVNGSTVSYNGGHLTRWSQLADGAARTEILRGSVLSNLDEMCEWGEEDNEQLNRMKVSDVEGDVNVAGVFQSWDDDDDTYTNDFYCAMTGDFVIRIAQGTTVARGDLLMSAGDGTAKPQDDDIVRSKTIAKVTSTTVSTTYSDGSYCVPCVLMAC